MSKVVVGLVPAIHPEEFLKSAKPKRQVKEKQYSDSETRNISDTHSK